MNLITILGALVLFFSFRMYAGDQVGNGGDVIVCSEDNRKRVELLDYYEGRERFGFKLGFGDPNVPYMEQVAVAIQRIKQFDMLRGQALEYFAGTFNESTHFWKGVSLSDLPDSEHIAIPINCKIEQIAIQKIPQFPEERFYTVSADLWDQLDETNKAGLVLHEIILRMATLEEGHINSIGTRYLNMQFAREAFESLGLAYKLSVLKHAKFSLSEWYVVNGLNMNFKKAEPFFYPNGKLKNAQLLVSQPYYINGSETHVHGDVEFHENGKLHKGIFSEPVRLNVGKREIAFAPNNFELSPNSEVLHGALLNAEWFNVGERNLKFKGFIWFNEIGAPLEGTLATDSAVTLKSGCELDLKADYTVRFFSSSLIKSVYFNSSQDLQTCLLDEFGKLESVAWRQYMVLNEAESPEMLSYPYLDKGFRVSGKRISVLREQTYFYPSGILKQGRISAKQTLMMANGIEKTFDPGQLVSFDEQGRVVE